MSNHFRSKHSFINSLQKLQRELAAFHNELRGNTAQNVAVLSSAFSHSIFRIREKCMHYHKYERKETLLLRSCIATHHQAGLYICKSRIIGFFCRKPTGSPAETGKRKVGQEHLVKHNIGLYNLQKV